MINQLMMIEKISGEKNTAIVIITNSQFTEITQLWRTPMHQYRVGSRFTK
jgi:hypothetical protein